MSNNIYILTNKGINLSGRYAAKKVNGIDRDGGAPGRIFI
jgi:hypothetical protein